MRRVQIVGHQRSGSHYLGALIEQNIFDSTDYVRHMSRTGHPTPKQVNLSDLSTLFIYTHRNFEDTLKSLHKIKDRFKLVGSFEDFKEKKIGELLYIKIPWKSEVEVNWIFNPKQQLDNQSSYFRSYSGMTLREWHEKVCTEWLAEIGRDNVMGLRYEAFSLKDDLEYKKYAMLIISEYLWDNKAWKPESFKDITERVGYYTRGKSW